MSRIEKGEPDWTRDEDVEARLDNEIADRYGLNVNTVVCARNDLDTLLWTFYHNPFSECEKLSLTIKNSSGWLTRDMEKVADALRRTDDSQVHELLLDLRGVISDLKNIAAELPRRPIRIQNVAVRYLISTWVHAERRPGYTGDRTLNLKFSGEKPTHASSEFICRMRERAKGYFQTIRASTIKRVARKIPYPPSPPCKVYPFDGNPRLLII